MGTGERIITDSLALWIVTVWNKMKELVKKR